MTISVVLHTSVLHFRDDSWTAFLQKSFLSLIIWRLQVSSEGSIIRTTLWIGLRLGKIHACGFHWKTSLKSVNEYMASKIKREIDSVYCIVYTCPSVNCPWLISQLLLWDKKFIHINFNCFPQAQPFTHFTTPIRWSVFCVLVLEYHLLFVVPRILGLKWGREAPFR